MKDNTDWKKTIPVKTSHQRSFTAKAVKMSAFVLAFSLLAPGFAFGAMTAPTPAPQDTQSPQAAANQQATEQTLANAERVGVDASKQLSLSLEEAIRLALENNNDIAVARSNVKSFQFELKGARGAYDPIFSSENYFQSSTTPTGSTLAGGVNGAVSQRSASSVTTLSGYTPWQGGSYQLSFDSTRTSTNNSFFSLNPQYQTSLTFSYTQPLLRNWGIDNNRRQLEVAKKNLSLTDAQFRSQVVNIISQVQSAYWDLVYARKNLEVQMDAVKQARAQLESNKRQVEAGTLAPLDVVSAETQVTNYEQSVYAAQEAVTTAENTLKTLLLPDRKHEMWSQALLPVTPVNVTVPRVSVEEATEAALKNRPEIAELQVNAEINGINTRYYRNQTKPQVDLIASYETTGLSGASVSNSLGNSTAPQNLIGGYGTSLSNLGSFNYPTARVGVKISLPLRNRTAEANLGKSLAESTSIKHQYAQREQQIEAEVRNALQAMRTAEARLRAATASRVSAEKQYEGEQLKFQTGVSTVFLVLERQQELVAARGNELQAQTTLTKAIAAYEKAVCSTLQVNHINVRAE